MDHRSRLLRAAEAPLSALFAHARRVSRDDPLRSHASLRRLDDPRRARRGAFRKKLARKTQFRIGHPTDTDEGSGGRGEITAAVGDRAGLRAQRGVSEPPRQILCGGVDGDAGDGVDAAIDRLLSARVGGRYAVTK